MYQKISKNKQINIFVKVSNILFALLLLVAVGFFIYFLTKIPYTNNDYKKISKNIGIAGTVFSFFPLGGLVFKYIYKFHDQLEYKYQKHVSTLLAIVLYWERKTRLLMAWCAIFALSTHLTIFASRIDNYFGHSEKYSWGWRNIIGGIAIGLIILMNLNGIGMLIMKKTKVWVDKIKYIGMFNLVCGIAFFVLVIIHIAVLE